MERDLFVEQMKNQDFHIDMKHTLHTINKCIDANQSDGNPRGHRNLIIVMEELSELSKEISKELRGKGDNVGILEELADVQLGIYTIQEICKINDIDLHKAMNVKMRRVEDALKSSGKYE